MNLFNNHRPGSVPMFHGQPITGTRAVETSEHAVLFDPKARTGTENTKGLIDYILVKAKNHDDLWSKASCAKLRP